ncbi:TadE/TadG family type IV pilus assembly protein [Spongiibacter tropicus]|uniref:TadE/TadG family type IV pilus assembly protein n=1 Tax=Spongiibacter tropicus TaxID=454602 RepID=UPI0003B5A00F|nr:TadE family protein [Spongiibacter tropicus]
MQLGFQSLRLSIAQRGQALPEMLIAFPLAVIMVMGVVQIALLYRGKATVNNATFLAARSGSLNHGYTENMENVFWSRMVALGHISPEARGNATTIGLFGNPDEANLLASKKALAISHSYKPVEVIWPTREVFDYFAISVKDLEPCSGSGCPFSKYGGGFKPAQKKIFEIPVDNLDARDSSLHVIDGRKINLLDANLLSIRTRYCYQLEVPVANFIIWRTLRVINSENTDWLKCEGMRGVFGRDHYFIPVVGRSVIRMQTGFRCEGDGENGVNCKNL